MDAEKGVILTTHTEQCRNAVAIDDVTSDIDTGKRSDVCATKVRRLEGCIREYAKVIQRRVLSR